MKPFQSTTLYEARSNPAVRFAVLDISKDPLVSDASDEFRREAGRTYIEILGKGMAK